MVSSETRQPAPVPEAAEKVQRSAGVRTTVDIVAQKNDPYVASPTVVMDGDQAASEEIHATMYVADGVGQH